MNLQRQTPSLCITPVAKCGRVALAACQPVSLSEAVDHTTARCARQNRCRVGPGKAGSVGAAGTLPAAGVGSVAGEHGPSRLPQGSWRGPIGESQPTIPVAAESIPRTRMTTIVSHPPAGGPGSLSGQVAKQPEAPAGRVWRSLRGCRAPGAFSGSRQLVAGPGARNPNRREAPGRTCGRSWRHRPPAAPPGLG